MQVGGPLSTERCSGSVTAAHVDALTRHIELLKQAQCLLSYAGISEATLIDLASFITGLQHEYGTVTFVEDVIQDMIGKHLLLQYQSRIKCKK